MERVRNIYCHAQSGIDIKYFSVQYTYKIMPNIPNPNNHPSCFQEPVTSFQFLGFVLGYNPQGYSFPLFSLLSDCLNWAKISLAASKHGIGIRMCSSTMRL